jgi:hypothetical protein
MLQSRYRGAAIGSMLRIRDGDLVTEASSRTFMPWRTASRGESAGTHSTSFPTAY